MVAFYIPFMQAGIGKPSVIEFAYVYGIKALAKNIRFWYTTKGICGIRDNMDNYKDNYFFYRLERPGEFKPACKQWLLCYLDPI